MNRQLRILLIPLLAVTVVVPAKSREHESSSGSPANGQAPPASSSPGDLETAAYICTGPPVFRFFANKDSANGENRQQIYKFAWTDACRQAERAQSVLIDLALIQL